MMVANDPVTPEFILRKYLYGSNNTPDLLTDRLRDLPPYSSINIGVIDTDSYLPTYGRYMTPAYIPYVHKFFSGQVSLPVGVHIVSELEGTINGADFTGSISNANIDVGSEDYFYRAFIFGHASFSLSPDTQFVVEENGEIHMGNIRIIPDQDNFDFIGTGNTQQYDDYIAKPEIDPSEIGRKITWNYSRPTDAKSGYYVGDFANDAVQIANTYADDYVAAAAVLASTFTFFNKMKSEHVYENIRNGQYIVYDGLGINTISAKPEGELGSILIGGSGNDMLHGGVYDDTFYGGSGDDTIKPDVGANDIWGGDEESKPEYLDTDTADYSDGGCIDISLDYTKNDLSTEVFHDGGLDKLHSIERIIGTSKTDRVKVIGAVPADIKLTIDALGGQGENPADTIDLAGSSNGVYAFIANDGTGYIRDEVTLGCILLAGFRTSIIGSEHSDVIADHTDGAKHFVGGDGDDTISIAGTTGNSTLLGGKGSDTLTGGNGNDVIIGGGGLDDVLHGGAGSDLIISGSGSRRMASEGSHIDGGDGDDKIVVNDQAIVRGGAGNDLYDVQGIAEIEVGSGDGHDTVITGEDGSATIYFTDASSTRLVWDAHVTSLSIDYDGFPTYFLKGDMAIISDSGESVFVGKIEGSRRYYGGQGQDVFSPWFADNHPFGFGMINLNEMGRVHFFGTVADDGITLDVTFGSVAQYNVAAAGYEAGVRAGASSPDSTPGNDDLSGTPLDDSISSGDGDDTIQASKGHDFINGGAGNDTLDIFGDRSDFSIGEGANGTVVVTNRADPEDHTTIASVENLYFDYDGQNDNILLGTVGDDIALVGTSDNDEIIAFDGDDLIDGAGGENNLVGGNGSDRYRISQMLAVDGSDTIDDTGTKTDTDIVDLGEIGSSVLVASISGDDIDLGIVAGSHAVSLIGQLAGNGVELLTFARNGVTTTFDRKAILDLAFASVVEGTSGDDALTGTQGNDLLVGHAGNDILTGGAGSDLYRYALGDGSDTIIEQGSSVETNVLNLSNLNLSDVQVLRVGNDLNIRIIATDEVITVVDHFIGDSGSGPAGIEQLIFDDSTTWDRTTIQRLAWYGGTPGADNITGSNNDDTLVGAKGDDTLTGGRGSDSYRYASGDGNDVIHDQGLTTDTDVLRLTDLNSNGIALSRIGDDLDLKIVATGEVIRVDGQFWADHGDYGIEQIQFADGTVWNREQIRQAAWFRGTTADDELGGTDLDDTFAGGVGNDTLRGGKGGDTYVYTSGDGADIIDDPIGVLGETDTLKLTDLNAADVTLRRVDDDVYVNDSAKATEILLLGQLTDELHGVEQIQFANDTIWNREQIKQAAWLRGTTGDDELSGTALGDTLAGGLGNDTLRGGNGSDTYVYASGDGADIIDEQTDAAGEIDVLQLTNRNAADMTLRRDGDDVYIKDNAKTSEILLSGQFADELHGIEQIQFADGTILNREQIRLAAWFRGAAGDDEITGSASNDTIAGGLGNDTLRGGNGGDTYVYASGDGADTIDDQTDAAGEIDTLKLVNLNATGVTLRRVGDDVYVKDNAKATEILLSGQFADDLHGIEQIQFADGSTWNREQIRQAAWFRGTGAADDISGTPLNDTFVGGLGDDGLHGGNGSDTYIYSSGDGADAIDDGTDTPGEVDTLKLTNLNATEVTLRRVGDDVYVKDNAKAKELLLSGQFADDLHGIEQIQFADGSVWNREQIRQAAWYRGTTATDDISGSPLGDTFVGGLGNDTLHGGNGSDTYIYASGDGADTIDDGTDTPGEVDTLKFTNLNAADLTLRRVGDDVYVKDNIKAKEIVLSAQFADDLHGIEQIQFADGTMWNREQIRQAAWYRGTTVADDITGSPLGDTFLGGLGNDTLHGGNGGDTYVYASGDGADIIDDGTDTPGEIDTVKLTTLNAADLTVRRVGDDVYVKDNAKAKEILLSSQFADDLHGIEQVQFADGTMWNREQLRQAAWFRGTSAADTMNGTPLGDTFQGAAGNDTISGGAGGDTYVYASGDGADTIIDETTTAGEIDTLKFTNLNVADVTLRRVGDQVYVKDNAKAKEILLQDQFVDDLHGIEQIQFADGTIWNREQIRQAAWFRGTTGADTLTGTALKDTFQGGAGNDTIDGGAGIDTSVYAGAKATYSLTTTGGVVKLKDNDATTDGNDGTDTVKNIETLQFKDGTSSITSPIVLDLDGNGTHLIDQSVSHARFDWNGDGVADQSGWIGRGDGFLALDRNGDGTALGADELSFIDDKPGAASDLGGLVAFDSNGDGLLSSLDAAWSHFGVWRDDNGNGAVDPGEYLSMAQAGVASIGLVGTPVESEHALGENLIVNTGTFTRLNGSIGGFADVALGYGDVGPTNQKNSQAVSATGPSAKSSNLNWRNLVGAWKDSDQPGRGLSPTLVPMDDGYLEPLEYRLAGHAVSRATAPRPSLSKLRADLANELQSTKPEAKPYVDNLSDDIVRSASRLSESIAEFMPVAAGQQRLNDGPVGPDATFLTLSQPTIDRHLGW